MWKFFRSTVESELPTPPTPAPDSTGSPSELRRLQLEVAERDRTITTLRGDVDRLTANQLRQINDAIDSRLETVFSDTASVISQLLMQADLIENGATQVPAKDVLRLARRLIRALEDAGIELQGSVGQRMVFDPNLHEALSTDEVIKRGQDVIVRLVGVAYKGRVLRKSGVVLGDK
jgi:molecular chaperone GrpE (heat shock protein)